MARKLHFHFKEKQEEAKERLRAFLEKNDFDVDDTVQAWSILRFRREVREWTQVYSGLTSKAREPRAWFKVVGPEENVIITISGEQENASNNY